MTLIFGSPEAQAVIDADKELVYETKTYTETINCHKCGKEVELTYETEEWEQHGRTWKHSSYGPGVGYCENCHIIFCDSWDGLTAYHDRAGRK